MKIDIDWDDIAAVTKLMQQCKSRILILNKDRITTTERQARIYNSCRNILETDISCLYDTSSDTRKYYVYAHCDTSRALIKTKRDGKVAFAASLGLNYFPFYIGKGTGNRAYDLNRNETHRKVRQRLSDYNRDVDITIIQKDLLESEALALESKLIDIFGVVGKGGKLVNLDEGKESDARRSFYMNDLKVVNSYYNL